MSEGVKRYQPASIEGRVARIVEDRARAEFGPELLDKEEVAAALNLSGEALTEAEWEEISEFAVNAGAELLARAVSHDPLPTTPKEEARLERQINKNKYRMFPIHDLFHAADEYRATRGAAVTAPFVEVGVRERYTDPSLIRSELWPALFLISETMDAPLAVSLATPEGRQDLDEALGEGEERPSPIRREISELLDEPVPETPEALRREYERLVGLLVIANAVEKVPDIVEREVLALRAEAARVGENPESWYDQFAERVFKGEWRENPRLFLDELLAAIDYTRPMHESIDTTPSPERPQYRTINDPAPKYLGEIRVDLDGQLWECVLGNHTVARELEIEASGDKYWEERLKTISDDASRAMDKAVTPENPHDSVFGDPALTWRPFSGSAPDATLH